MTAYIFPPPATPALAIAHSDQRFPIRRVICVGRNYASHAREMGSDPDREPPFFFMKPADAVVAAAGVLPYPGATNELHYEVELVVALKDGGENIAVENALDLVWGYGVGLDLTRRDLQAQAKETRRPWDFSKGFDNSAPCSPLAPASAIGHPDQARIFLEVNGKVVQDGSLNELIWPIADILAHISRFMALQPGDLIFSGTPSGVGALEPGDQVHGEVVGVASFDLTVGPKP
ncbi:MAG: fumarylacetoacetate hydrolase [Massilia sp.]|nr:fumarylacetoacetate hydrolase [Massilia sp.]